MKKLFAIAAFLAASWAHASVGVAVGANTFAKDGMPMLGPDEQAKVFVCHGKFDKTKSNPGMNGPDAENCAMQKCLAYYNMPLNSSDKKAKAHCVRDGWAEKKGWAIIVLGPKGDNNFMFSKAIGDDNKKDAWDFVRSNNFPVDKGTLVHEFYDDNTNGKDVWTPPKNR